MPSVTVRIKVHCILRIPAGTCEPSFVQTITTIWFHIFIHYRHVLTVSVSLSGTDLAFGRTAPVPAASQAGGGEWRGRPASGGGGRG